MNSKAFRAQAGFARAMRKLGGPVRLQSMRESQGTTDPDTGDTTPSSRPALMSVPAIIQRITTRTKDGQTVRRGLIALIDADPSLVIETGDELISDDVRYRVTGAPLLHFVDGEAICWRLSIEAGGTP